jgi:hypothetical protein
MIVLSLVNCLHLRTDLNIAFWILFFLRVIYKVAVGAIVTYYCGLLFAVIG